MLRKSVLLVLLCVAVNATWADETAAVSMKSDPLVLAAVTAELGAWADSEAVFWHDGQLVTKEYQVIDFEVVDGYTLGGYSPPQAARQKLREIGANLAELDLPVDVGTYVIGMVDGTPKSGTTAGSDKDLTYQTQLGKGDRAQVAKTHLEAGAGKSLNITCSKRYLRFEKVHDPTKRGVVVVWAKVGYVPVDLILPAPCDTSSFAGFRSDLNEFRDRLKKVEDREIGRWFTFGPSLGFSYVNAHRDYAAPTVGIFFEAGIAGMYAEFGHELNNIDEPADQISQVGVWVRFAKRQAFWKHVGVWGAAIDARQQAGRQYGWGEYYMDRSSALAGGLMLDFPIFQHLALDLRAGGGVFDNEQRVPDLKKERQPGLTAAARLRVKL